MKSFIISLTLIVSLFLSCSRPKQITQTVEASCGQCQFDLKTQKGCDLAIKINGKAYFVEGAHIDDYGDAHDENIGFCNVVRKAKVTGKISSNKFLINSFEIIN